MIILEPHKGTCEQIGQIICIHRCSANKETTLKTYKQYTSDIVHINARELFELFSQLESFDVYYIKKESEHFVPLFRKEDRYFHGVSIMWSDHGKTRNSLKECINDLSKEALSVSDFK